MHPRGAWPAIAYVAIGGMSLLALGCGASADLDSGKQGRCPDEICTTETTSGGGATGATTSGTGANDAADVRMRDPLCGPPTDGVCDPDWNTCEDATEATDAADGTADTDAADLDGADDASAVGDRSETGTGGLPLDAGASPADGAAPFSDAKLDGESGVAPQDATGIDDGSTSGGALVDRMDASAPPADASTPTIGSSDGGQGPADSSDAATADGRDTPAPARACRIRASASGGPVAMCEIAGSVPEGGACAGSADCRPGLACVVDTDTQASSGAVSEAGEGGVCRPYCCGGTCQLGAFCAPKPLYERSADGSASAAAPLMVPACTPLPSCRLLDATSCPAGTTCAPIGSGRATACVETGSAKRDDPCDDGNHCQAGLVCVKSIGRCVSLCRTADGGTDCEEGTCQGQSDSLPVGFGLCITDTSGPDGY